MKIFLCFCCAIALASVAAQKNGQQATENYDAYFTSERPAEPAAENSFGNQDNFVPNKKMHDEFDWKLMQKVLQKSDSNVILSPLSVKIPLTLLAEAAGRDVPSQTQLELSQVLPDKGSLFDAKDYYKLVFDSLNEKSDDYTLNLATKIFADKYIAINQRFASIAESVYHTKTENFDFAQKRESSAKINEWVSEITNGHIKDLVTEESVSQAVLLMLNAIYFKGTWRQGFLRNETTTEKFSVTPSKKVDAKFMKQTGQFYYGSSKNLDSKILRMPYKGRRFALYIIVPNTVGGINELVKKLEAETLKTEIWNMNSNEVRVSIPKFKFDTTTQMVSILEELGIRQIFTNNASLPLLARAGQSAGQLKVSNIIQKAGLIVNEEGSTAYAATELQLVNKFGGEAVDFVADRPFIYYIEDETTGAKLFAGRVSDPSKFKE